MIVPGFQDNIIIIILWLAIATSSHSFQLLKVSHILSRLQPFQCCIACGNFKHVANIEKLLGMSLERIGGYNINLAVWVRETVDVVTEITNNFF